jgi:hypothetical protein
LNFDLTLAYPGGERVANASNNFTLAFSGGEREANASKQGEWRFTESSPRQGDAISAFNQLRIWGGEAVGDEDLQV